MKETCTRGFSLIEVVIGVGLMMITFVGIAQISQLVLQVRNHCTATNRLENTMSNLVTDTQVLLRYDGPSAQAVQSGLIPASFIVYQWEPDLAQAPVTCRSEHLTQPTNMLEITCTDRGGRISNRRIALDGSQPYPSSLVTAAPAAETP